MIPATPEAFQLLMEGSAALADAEANGMRIDVPYLDKAIDWTKDKIRELGSELKADDIYAEWRKVYGERADLGKRLQLADVLFNRLGYECKQWTASTEELEESDRRPKTDEEALDSIDLPFVKKWIDREKLKKLLSTNLLGTRKLVDSSGFLHPFFHLNFATTYRSSSSDPNFQNYPNRDQRLAKIIRRAFIPRTKDHVIVEIDYGALEFRGAACFWRDDAMVAYASDPSLDIHRDIAAACYMIDTDEVTKEARAVGKNSFVFPTLYGSYYGNTGKHLWSNIDSLGLKTVSGIGLRDVLARKGILGIDGFTEHIKEVEQEFNDRFPTWRDAKEPWWNNYLKHGEFQLMTGFVCRGIYSYNNLMNTPIQGPSFHCLLWSLVKVNEWLKRNKMRSCLAGQIHDSIFAYAHKDELEDFISSTVRIMTEDIRKSWPWIITPLEAEVEVSPTNWFDKSPWKGSLV